jgi:hypothetical protein
VVGPAGVGWLWARLNDLIQIKYHTIQTKTIQKNLKQLEPNKLQLKPNMAH